MTKFLLFTETEEFPIIDDAINNWISENPSYRIIDWKMMLAENPMNTGYCGPMVMIQYVEPILEDNNIYPEFSPAKGALYNATNSKKYMGN